MLASEHLIFLRKVSTELSEIIRHAREINSLLASKQIERIANTYDLVENIERLIQEEKAILEKVQSEFKDEKITEQLKKAIAVGKNCADFDTNELKKLLDIILNLDVLIFQALTKPEKIAELDPDFLEKLIKISKKGPYELYRRGFLCRGISRVDYEKLLQGHPLEGSNNFSVTPYQHIMQRYNEAVVNSPFISLSSDPVEAMKWGDVLIVVSVNNIDGHVHSMDDLIVECNRDGTATRFIKKNSEFLLGPKAGRAAKIPWQALLVA